MKAKKIILISLLTFLVLVGTLVAHIYAVTSSKDQDTRFRALARVDFLQDIDSTEANQIKAWAREMNGVEGTYFNVKDNILVYGYYPKKVEKADVYAHIMSKGDYKAKPYVVDASKGISGCPVMGNNGFTKRVVVYYYNMKKKLFNT